MCAPDPPPPTARSRVDRPKCQKETRTARCPRPSFLFIGGCWVDDGHPATPTRQLDLSCYAVGPPPPPPPPRHHREDEDGGNVVFCIAASTPMCCNSSPITALFPAPSLSPKPCACACRREESLRCRGTKTATANGVSRFFARRKPRVDDGRTRRTSTAPTPARVNEVLCRGDSFCMRTYRKAPPPPSIPPALLYKYYYYHYYYRAFRLDCRKSLFLTAEFVLRLSRFSKG